MVDGPSLETCFPWTGVMMCHSMELWVQYLGPCPGHSQTKEQFKRPATGFLTVPTQQMSTAIWDALTSLDWFAGDTQVSHKTYKRYSSFVQVTSRLEHLRLYWAVMAVHPSQALGFLCRGGKHCQYWRGLHQPEEFRHLQYMKSHN